MSRVYTAVKAIIVRGDKFLVLKQKVADGSLVWDLPGGRLEYGESPYNALRREVKEETNLTIDIEKVAGVWWFFRDKTDNGQVVCVTFLCFLKSGEISFENNADDSETLVEYKWITKKEFRKSNTVIPHESLLELINSIF